MRCSTLNGRNQCRFTSLIILAALLTVTIETLAEFFPLVNRPSVLPVDFEDHDVTLLNYDDGLFEDDPANPCNPQHCHATFEHVYSVPIRLPCSTASGEVPDAAHLPLVYPGDYDQCKRVYGFAGGHYCTIDTAEFIGIPLRKGLTRFTGEGLGLGRLHIGKCVSKQCTAELLRKTFLKGLHTTAKKLQRRMPLQFFIPFVEQTIINSTSVRCVDEDEETRGSVWDRPGSTFAAVLSIILLTFVTSATLYDLYLTRNSEGEGAIDQQQKTTSSRVIVNAISIRHSLHSLFAPISGDFLTLNGIRVVSMAWIIYGHVVFFSSGLPLPFPIWNPSAIDEQVQSIYINLSRAAEFSVDTFFFMSAFLACWGCLQEESKRLSEDKTYSFSFSNFVRNIVLRYVRLTPVYAFVLLFYIKLFPHMGSGPFYHAYQGIEFREEECKNWWTNLLYVNNLVPYGETGGLRGCAGWTWYLANDMQYFLLVMPSVYLFLFVRSRYPNLFLVSYLPCIVLILIQLSATFWVMNRYDIYGAFDPDFNVHLYVKPWCRVAPFAIGMAFAFWHFSRTTSSTENGESVNTWRSDSKLFYGISPLLVVSLAFAVLIVIAFSTYDQFRCKAENPSSDCRIYAGFAVYGALFAHNWDHTQLTFYFTLTYGSWAFALGLICMYFFSGRGGFVNRMLSHYVLTPMARLTYSVYLVHIPVIQYIYLTSPAPLHISKKLHVVDTLAVFILAYIIALALFLFVERPAMSLVSLVLHRHSSTSKAMRTPPAGVVDDSNANQQRQPLLSSST